MNVSSGVTSTTTLFVGALSIFRYPARYFGLMAWRKLRGRAEK
jgi:hypothetical protein